MKDICVLGAGSWGSTLAGILADNKNNVTLWEFDKDAARNLARSRTIPVLPALKLPAEVKVTADISEAVKGKKILLSAVPSHFVRSTLRSVKKSGFLDKDAGVISATKGIEVDTLMRMSEVIEEELDICRNNICVISGPSHAEEVVLKIPTAIVAASKSSEIAKLVQKLFMTKNLRIYTTTDVNGVELGGSLKNIYAIACGISDGLRLGDNTKAALITRGLTEMVRLGTYLGGMPSTFFGLSGVGDLIVTCFSKYSRNRLIGEKIGHGKKLRSALKEMTMVAEGVKTTRSAYSLGKKFSVDLPIIGEIYKCLYEDKNAKDSLRDLMERPAKPELDKRIVEAMGNNT